MTCADINIRDPFILAENGTYYMYGTRAENFGERTGGFDVYTSSDLKNWSNPIACFDSNQYGMNQSVNWAPEVHKYQDGYYMFATFHVEKTGLIGTYILRSDHPLGPFVPHSHGVVTPAEWRCLDGTLYVSKEGKPYMVFCHEHIQIIDGTICYIPLRDDLTEAVGDPVTIFAASSCPWADNYHGHFVTDGPFMYRSTTGELLMIWSSFIKDQYAEMLVRFDDGELGLNFTHLPPILDSDGGHGMLFTKDSRLHFTFHTPNTSEHEHPAFVELTDKGDTICIK